jgi:hypothetical protein
MSATISKMYSRIAFHRWSFVAGRRLHVHFFGMGAISLIATAMIGPK